MASRVCLTMCRSSPLLDLVDRAIRSISPQCPPRRVLGYPKRANSEEAPNSPDQQLLPLDQKNSFHQKGAVVDRCLLPSTAKLVFGVHGQISAHNNCCIGKQSSQHSGGCTLRSRHSGLSSVKVCSSKQWSSAQNCPPNVHLPSEHHSLLPSKYRKLHGS